MKVKKSVVDKRSQLVKARDEWIESEDGKRCLEGSAQGKYLENRLVIAFLAGAAWGEKQAQRLHD